MKKYFIISALLLLTGFCVTPAIAAPNADGELLALTSTQIETIQKRREARYNELKTKHEQNKESIKNEVSFWKKLINDDSAKTEAQKKQEAVHESVEKEVGFWRSLFTD